MRDWPLGAIASRLKSIAKATEDVAAELDRRSRPGALSLVAVRGAIEAAVRDATGWEDLQKFLETVDLEYVERGGGLAIRRRSNDAILCKACEAGPAYSELIRRFRSPFPGHAHQRLADKVLGEASIIASEMMTSEKITPR